MLRWREEVDAGVAFDHDAKVTGADAVDELAEYTKAGGQRRIGEFSPDGCALSPMLEGGNYGQFSPGAFGQHCSSDARWPYWRSFPVAAPGGKTCGVSTDFVGLLLE